MISPPLISPQELQFPLSTTAYFCSSTMTCYTDHAHQQQNAGHRLSLVASPVSLHNNEVFLRRNNFNSSQCYVATRQPHLRTKLSNFQNSHCDPYQLLWTPFSSLTVIFATDAYSTKYARAMLSIFRETWVLAVVWGVVCGFPSGWFY